MAEECSECQRRELLKFLKELEDQVPEGVGGFGKHDDYIMGMVAGISNHIQAVRSEVEKIAQEIDKFGKESC